MTAILIVESNTPDIVDKFREWGELPLGDAFGSALRQLEPDIEIFIAAPYAGQRVNLTGIDAVVFTGSGVEWSTADTRAKPLADVMEKVFAAGLPCYGSCNGLQLAAVVLGGAVAASPNGREDGLARDITLTEAGLSHPMMSGRTKTFSVPCVHRDEVRRLPEGAVLLAGNAHSPVQSMVYERDGILFWGTQYHPEFSAPFVGGYLARKNRIPESMSADLKSAEFDPAAAASLGTSNAEMGPAVRMTELRNWLACFLQASGNRFSLTESHRTQAANLTPYT